MDDRHGAGRLGDRGVLRGEGRERLLSEHNISERQLDLALSYREAYPREIDEALEENARTPEEWHELYPAVVPPRRHRARARFPVHASGDLLGHDRRLHWTHSSPNKDAAQRSEATYDRCLRCLVHGRASDYEDLHRCNSHRSEHCWLLPGKRC